MKKFYTLILISFYTCISGQNSSLTIHIDKACGEDFTEATEVKLFEILGNQKIQIASSFDKPAVFNNLFSDRPYIVEVSSTAIPNNEISVEDLVHMVYYVLGIEPLKNPGIFAGETNSNGGLTTIDIVQMTRDKLDLEKLNDRNWFFVAEENTITTSVPVSDVINRIYIDKLNSLNKSITFFAYEKYNITSSLVKECNDCGMVADESFSISTINIDVVENQDISIPISFFTTNDQTLGCFFTLKVKDAIIKEVQDYNNTLDKISNELNEVSFINFSANYFSNYYNIGSIKIRPLKNGKVWDFFEIIPNSVEVTYREGECLLNSKNISFTTNATCPIEWPPLNITVPDCTDKYETGRPTFDDACIPFMYVTYKDFPITWPDGSCYKVIRTWTVLNWLTNEIIEKYQIIKYLPDFNPVCIKSNVFVPETGTLITARSLVEDAFDNHYYSFSKNNITDSIRQLQNVPPLDQYFSIYDINDSSFCLAKVNKITNCDPTLNINSGFSLSSKNGFYTLKAIDFDGGNDVFCQGAVKKFNISLFMNDFYKDILTLEYENFKGDDLVLHLKYLLNDVWVYYGTVKVKLLLDDEMNNSPFEFQCFNDAITKNELFEIAFFSPTFEKLYGIQGAIKVTDANLIKTTNVSFSDMYYNNSNNVSRFIWSSALPISLNVDDTIFTMTILPLKSGKLIDFIAIDDASLQGEAYLDDLNTVKVDLNFSFLNRTTSTVDLHEELTISPNPVDRDVIIYELPSSFRASSYFISNSQGKRMLSGRVEASGSQGSISLTSTIVNGVYFLTFTDDVNTLTKKLIVIR